MSRDFDWSERRVCVTGAAGFIGSWLVRTLVDDGAKILAVVRPNGGKSPILETVCERDFVLFESNLEDVSGLAEAMRINQCDTVFHLAASNDNTGTARSALPIFESNIRGTYNILEACRLCADQVKRILFVSSREADRVPHDAPLHPYAASKYCGEVIARAYAGSYGLPVGIAKSDNVYGGGDLNFNRIIPHVIKVFSNERRPVLKEGHSRRGFIYVVDMVNALKFGAANLGDSTRHGTVFSFQADESVTINSAVELIALIMKKQFVVARSEDQGHRSGRVDALGLSSTVAPGLSWRPNVSLQEGLEATTAWYQEYFREIE